MHRAVLWNIEVQGLTIEQVTEILGITPKKVVVELSMARLRFRNRWLEAQRSSSLGSSTCRQFLPKVAAYRRHTMDQGTREQFQQHLQRCMRCAILVQESEYLSKHLGTALGPVLIPNVSVGAAV